MRFEVRGLEYEYIPNPFDVRSRRRHRSRPASGELAVKFPSEPPPTRAAPTLNPSSEAMRWRLLQKLIRSFGRFHRWAIESARDFITRSIQGLNRFQRGVDACRFILRPDAQIHSQIHSIRHNVRHCSAFDHVRSERCPFFYICNLISSSIKCAALIMGILSLFWFDSLMRGFAIHLNVVIAHALARNFQIAVHKRSFKH